jgi:hypothetical protein
MTSPGFRKVQPLIRALRSWIVLAQSKALMGISDISGRLDLNKSTVFNKVGLDVRAQAITYDKEEYIC